jgi:hypothetical protein
MNTDNMTISGETIDYGPCAFMEAYDPATNTWSGPLAKMPTARSGLMLFLRRGMWGWAQTLAAGSPAPEPIYASSLTRPARNERTAVVHVLATMAMSTHDRRSP